MRSCEADVLALEGWDDPDVEPCTEEGVVAFADRWLCSGCWEALQILRGIRK